MSVIISAPQQRVTLPGREATAIVSVDTLTQGEPVQAISEDEFNAHVDASEPHPAYDDLPSFTLLFENGLI